MLLIAELRRKPPASLQKSLPVVERQALGRIKELWCAEIRGKGRSVQITTDEALWQFRVATIAGIVRQAVPPSCKETFIQFEDLYTREVGGLPRPATSDDDDRLAIVRPEKLAVRMRLTRCLVRLHSRR